MNPTIMPALLIAALAEQRLSPEDLTPREAELLAEHYDAAAHPSGVRDPIDLATVSAELVDALLEGELGREVLNATPYGAA